MGEKTLEGKEIIVSACINGIAFIDLNGNLTYVNNSFLKMWGYGDRNEVLGRRSIKFWHEEKKALEIIKTVKEKGEWTGELIAVKKNTSTFPVHLFANMVTNKLQGAYIMASFVDMTECKRAEEELDKYRSLYNSMSEAVALHEIIYDKSGVAEDYKVLDVNPSFERLFEIKKEQLVNKRASQIKWTSTTSYLELFVNVADSGQSTSFETYFPCINKCLSISVFSPQRGQFAAVFTDITQRKQMEKTLMESQEIYSDLIEHARDGVVIIQDEVYQFSNQAALKIIGCATNKVVGESYLDIFTPESKNLISQKYNECLTGKKVPICYETKIHCKNGTLKDTDISFSCIQYKGRAAIMAIIRDNTKRKKTEMELQKAQKLESIGTLAGGIAHDFNNLLTGIIGNLSLAKLYSNPEDHIFSILAEAEKASCQAKKLTKEFLVFSKGGELIKKDVSLLRILKDIAELSLSGSKSICKLSLPDDLWRAEIDEGQIIQAINNVLSNAEQSMAGGGIITLSAENLSNTDDTVLLKDALLLKGGNFVKITIKDEGIGIQEKYLDKIFDPYFTTKQKGSGLGLAVTYGIIKKHGGYITVESTVGVGTIFTIYLPALGEKIFTTKNSREDKFDFGRGKILFMDDQKIIRDMIKNMLIHLGYEVEFATDGAEAVELYEKAKESGHSFDVAILDLTVPGGMGGKEAIKKLLEIDPKAKAIVSSGYFNDPIMSDYKQYGFKGVVAKPYHINELNETLHTMLTGVKERDENLSHSFEMTSL